MCKKNRQGFLVFVVVIFAAAQLVRPTRVNPATDPGKTIQAHMGATNGLAAVLDRSCRDCHSNTTVWRWYTQVAPVSWLMASGVAKGRSAVNFSEWGNYSPDARRTLLSASCEDVSRGRMPGPYTFIRPETRLSPQDIETICRAAQQADSQALAGDSK